MITLLMACSATKKDVPCEARQIYQGTMFKRGLLIAEKYGFEVIILSAKHGFIADTEIIEPYNQKLAKPYDGDWPEGSGFYLGGSLYFKNAPERFQPLVPVTKFGYKLSNLLYVLGNFANRDILMSGKLLPTIGQILSANSEHLTKEMLCSIVADKIGVPIEMIQNRVYSLIKQQKKQMLDK